MNHEVKLLSKFTQYLSHFNQEHVMETLALCRYFHIYQDIDKNKFTHEYLTKWNGISYDISDHDSLQALGGYDYNYMNKGYLKEVETLFNSFYRYKLAMSFPGIKVADCPKPEKAKEKIIKLSTQLIEIIDQINDSNIHDGFNKPIADKNIVTKYHEYVHFSIKYMLSYCSTLDNDFKLVGNQLFSDFDSLTNKQNPKVFDAITVFINHHLTQYQKEIDLYKNNDQYPCVNIAMNDSKIAHIFNYLQNKEQLDSQVLKLILNSHDKGKLGEQLFSGFINGEVVGYKNNKVDIIDENNNNISLKTSYTHSWNHHLAYLNENNSSHSLLIEAINNKTPLNTIREIDWSDVVKSFISGKEAITELVFQKIMLDESGNDPIDVKVWLSLIHI